MPVGASPPSDVRAPPDLEGRSVVKTPHPYRRYSDDLILSADALLLSFAAGTVLVLAKDLAALPAAWVDPMGAFLITMALASVVGGTASWLIHRRPTGARGMRFLAIGLAVAVAVLLGVETVIVLVAISAPGTANWLFGAAQVVGLVVLLPPLVASASDLISKKRRHIDLAAVARMIGMTALTVLIAFRFLPQSWIAPDFAQLYAILGLSTTAGALGVAVADGILLVTGRRAAPGGAQTVPRPNEG
jgi:hypothetical protein